MPSDIILPRSYDSGAAGGGDTGETYRGGETRLLGLDEEGKDPRESELGPVHV